MFKISPIQEAESQSLYAKMCGADYKEGCFAYGMKDVESGELMGFSQFEIGEGVGHITDLRPRLNTSDNEAMFILGRATMNFIDLCGAHLCTADKNASDPALLHAIGFKTEKDGLLFCDMNGMFDGHCEGHNK